MTSDTHWLIRKAMKARYTASQRPTKDGTGRVMAFRHPLRKDPRGKQGLKMRRGLNTADETRAQAPVDEINDLLPDTDSPRGAKPRATQPPVAPIGDAAFYAA